MQPAFSALRRSVSGLSNYHEIQTFSITSAKCILVTGSLQQCLTMWSVNLDALISGEYQTLGGHSCGPLE
jgi:hypothetical protein